MKEEKAGNTKARRITTKMKTEWAAELDKNGHLFCPMIGCFKKFVTVANFQTHYKWCTGKKDLQKCPYCDSLIIAAQKSVIQHMEAFHPERVDDYKRTYNVADSEVENSFVASDNDATMNIEEVYDEVVQSSKRRKYVCKENKSSNKVIWKHKMKSINEEAIKNIDQFQKCVRFDSIVDKINSVDEVVHTIEEIQKATDVKSTKMKKPKHHVPENIIKKELYFEDSDDGYTDQDMSEQESKRKKTGTKAIFVLDKDCYKRYHENLTMTRDWSTARKTYTRSRNSDSFNDSSLNAQVLSDQSQEAFQMNDNLKTYPVTLTPQQNAIGAQFIETTNIQTEPDSTIELQDEHQLNESIESKNLCLHLEPQNIDTEIVLKSPVKTLEIDLVIQPHQYSEVNQNLYEEIQENTELNLKEQKNIMLLDTKSRLPKKQTPLVPIITYGAQVSENHCISSRDVKVDFNNIMRNSEDTVNADELSKDGRQINFFNNTSLSPNVSQGKMPIWKRLATRKPYGKCSNFKSSESETNKLSISFFVNKSRLNKNLKQSTQALRKLKRMKIASSVVKKKMAERQIARNSKYSRHISCKVRQRNIWKRNSISSNVMYPGKKFIQTKNNMKSPLLRKEKSIKIAENKKNSSKFKSFSEVSDFLYEQTAASYNKVISNVILDCEASLTDYEIVTMENDNDLHSVAISGEGDVKEKDTYLANETNSDAPKKESLHLQSDKTNISREIIEEVQLISNSNTSLTARELNSEMEASEITSLSSPQSSVDKNDHTDSRKEISSDHNSKPLDTAKIIYSESTNNISCELRNSEASLDENQSKYVDKNASTCNDTLSKEKETESVMQLPGSPLQGDVTGNILNATANTVSKPFICDESGKNMPKITGVENNLVCVKSPLINIDDSIQDKTQNMKIQDNLLPTEIVPISLPEKIETVSIDNITSENVPKSCNSHPDGMTEEASINETMNETENNILSNSTSANISNVEMNTKRPRGRPKKKNHKSQHTSSACKISIIDSLESDVNSEKDKKHSNDGQSIDACINISENLSPDAQNTMDSKELPKSSDIISPNKSFDISSNKYSNMSTDKLSDDISFDKIPDVRASDKFSDISSVNSEKENQLLVSVCESSEQLSLSVIEDQSSGLTQKQLISDADNLSNGATKNKRGRPALPKAKEKIETVTNTQTNDQNINAMKKKRGRPKKQLSGLSLLQDDQETVAVKPIESTSSMNVEFASDQFSSTSTPTRISARIKLKKSSLNHSHPEKNDTLSSNITASPDKNLTNEIVESSFVKNENSERDENVAIVNTSVENCKPNLSILKNQKGNSKISCSLLESSQDIPNLSLDDSKGKNKKEGVISEGSNLSQNESVVSAVSDSENKSIVNHEEQGYPNDLDQSKELIKPIKKRGRPKKNNDLSSTSLSNFQKMGQSNNSIDSLNLSVGAVSTTHSHLEPVKRGRGRPPKNMLKTSSVTEQQKQEISKELSRTAGALQVTHSFDPHSRKSPRKGKPKKCARYADINSAIENCDQILDSSSNDELEVLANMKKRKRRKQELISLNSDINFNTGMSNENCSKKAFEKEGIQKDKLIKDESSSVEVPLHIPLKSESKDSSDCLVLISEYDHLKKRHNFEDFRPKRSQWKILSESEQVQYYPPLIKSIPIRTSSEECDVELNCFENAKLDETNRHFAFFVGGPIWSTAWCPAPHLKAVQYVAIATSGNLAEYHSYVTKAEAKSLIQLWNLGYLEDTNFQLSPSLQICLAFNYGNIFDMVWCPYGCWDNPTEKQPGEVLPRLGLLAVASSDSFIRIYSFAHPETTVSNFPLYKASPSALLKPLNSNPGSFTQKSACVTVCWEKSSDCEKIAGGYGNGLICVWLLKTSSSLLTRRGEEVTFIPYLIFNAHGTPVTHLAFSPLSKNQWLVSNGFEKEVKFWDLNDTCMPCAIVKDGYASNVDWAAQCSGALINSHETVSFRATQFYRELDMENSIGISMDDCNSTPRITAYSEVMNALAIVDKTGAITTKYANTIHSIFKNPNRNFPRRRTYAGKLIIPPLKNYEDDVKDPFHDYSSSAVNTLSWNPNPSSCCWLIAGGHSGIARLSNVSDLKISDGDS